MPPLLKGLQSTIQSNTRSRKLTSSAFNPENASARLTAKLLLRPAYLYWRLQCVDRPASNHRQRRNRNLKALHPDALSSRSSAPNVAPHRQIGVLVSTPVRITFKTVNFRERGFLLRRAMIQLVQCLTRTRVDPLIKSNYDRVQLVNLWMESKCVGCHSGKTAEPAITP